MYDFNRVFLETEPLRKKLQEAERIVKEKMDLLSEKKALLASVEEKIRKLEEEYKRNIDRKEYRRGENGDFF